MDKTFKYQELTDKIDALSKTEEIHNILFEIIKAVTTTHNLKELYGFIHNVLNKIIKLPNFYIAIYDEAKRSIEFPYFKDQFDKEMSYIKDFTATHSLTGEVILSGKPLLLDQEELRLRRKEGRSIGTESKIWIGVPLIVQNKVIGVMAVQDYEDPEFFSRSDFEMFIFISGQIAFAIERRRMMDDLVESEKRFRDMAELLPEAIFEADENLIITYANSKTLKMLGYTKKDITEGISCVDLIAEENFKKAFTEESFSVDKEKIGLTGLQEYIFSRKDGSLFPGIIKTSSIERDSQQKGIRGVIIDISDQKKWEESLRQFRGYLKSIINSMPSILVGIDVKYKIILFNEHAEHKTGLASSDAEGQDLYETLPWLKAYHKKIDDSIIKQRVEEISKVQYKIKGELFYQDIVIYPLITGKETGAVIRIDDVTNQVKVESILIQTEKMISVGGLAAGMAHEINNPLAGMMQNAQVAYNRLSKDFPANEEAALKAGTTLDSIKSYIKSRNILDHIEKVNQAGAQAAEIVGNMLSFAKKNDSGKTLQSLSKQIDKTIELTRTDYDIKKKKGLNKIEIIREYDESMPDIPCSGSKIQQVVFNILKNSTQAFECSKENQGVLKITIRLYQSADMACMEIEDNGPGMDEKTLKRVFEPFFTTKEQDKGTGLGLSISYFIVTEDHGGEMSVESEKGNGTRFRIKLPFGNFFD